MAKLNFTPGEFRCPGRGRYAADRAGIPRIPLAALPSLPADPDQPRELQQAGQDLAYFEAACAHMY
jgi:hypothetical protein